MAIGSDRRNYSSRRRGAKAVALVDTMSRTAVMIDAADRLMRKLDWIPQWTLIIALGLVIWQAADRKPPFSVLAVEPAFAKPGELVTITAQVWRDQDRNCSVQMSRSVFDAMGARSDFPVTRFSDQLIDDMERKTPGILRVSFVVPPNAATGTAELVSVLDYRCNRVHSLWPIEVTTQMPFEVVP